MDVYKRLKSDDGKEDGGGKEDQMRKGSRLPYVPSDNTTGLQSRFFGRRVIYMV